MKRLALCNGDEYTGPMRRQETLQLTFSLSLTRARYKKYESTRRRGTSMPRVVNGNNCRGMQEDVARYYLYLIYSRNMPLLFIIFDNSEDFFLRIYKLAVFLLVNSNHCVPNNYGLFKIFK